MTEFYAIDDLMEIDNEPMIQEEYESSSGSDSEEENSSDSESDQQGESGDDRKRGSNGTPKKAKTPMRRTPARGVKKVEEEVYEGEEESSEAEWGEERAGQVPAG